MQKILKKLRKFGQNPETDEIIHPFFLNYSVVSLPGGQAGERGLVPERVGDERVVREVQVQELRAPRHKLRHLRKTAIAILGLK